MEKILVVDDEKFYIDVIVDMLGNDYKIAVAMQPVQALERAVIEPQPDLILLDVLMPEMDGYEVCRRLKADPRTQDIPVIFLTIKSEVSDELRGFKVGAVDYISKPMSPPIVKARVENHLSLSRAKQLLNYQNRDLKDEVLQRREELSRMKDAAITCMASLAETRDPETGKHIQRTQEYVLALAEHLKEHPRFCDYLNPYTIHLLYKTAPLHDIGKVGVPDNILFKPGPLSAGEWELLRKHTGYGYQALRRAEQEMGGSDFLKMAGEIAHSHHERWNGTGYPLQLAGDAIPISGRLMAIADVYDALISRRPYKEPFPHEKAVKMIRDGSGSQFDPDMVKAFLDIEQQFRKIASRLSDSRHLKNIVRT
jgi:putative two-component system response regulator